ncbi:MAG: hypothetical protein PHD95_02765 [Candidatus ainarchaeum sp.]|nr:hypothetical protein [Candidatus ainarchaeum sp.]
MINDIAVLWGKKNSTKDLIFKILISDHPLKLIELTNFIQRRYGKSVTFQAVRQAVLELEEDGILTRKKNQFQISHSWLLEAQKTLALVQDEIMATVKKPKSAESIKGEFSSFTFETLNDMMKFWQQLINHWFAEFKAGDYPYNCWQGQHIWEALVHLDTEKKIMEQLKQKKIKSYAVIFGNTPLDKYVKRFYESIGLKVKIIPPQTKSDNTYHVGTYGDLIIQAKYPKNLVQKIDSFFKKTKSFVDMDIKSLHDVISTKTEIKLTVIKNQDMAKQINKMIIVQWT